MSDRRKCPDLVLTALPALLTIGGAALSPLQAATLPVPCLAGGCGGAVQGWVTSGSVTATQVGSSLQINQSSATAELNWQSFNISSDGSVKFNQPSSSSLAINRIFQADPSQIFGALSANGRVYLINQNGILFGTGSQVNVASLVASTLDITPDALKNGIGVNPANPNGLSNAFVAFKAADGTVLSKPISIQAGASLSAPGGQIFIFAPEVDNQGTIRTPDGQTMLAAGNTVMLATSTDPNIRGLIVAVDGGGTVNNGAASNSSVTDPTKLIGQILADRGNVSLAGLAVNQLGLISATTAVRANGSIRLVAGDDVASGTVTLGAGSQTLAGLDPTDTSNAVDATVQPKSSIDIAGNDIVVEDSARILATSGEVTLSASAQPGLVSAFQTSPLKLGVSDGSRIYIAPDAQIDVSGASATVPMDSNVLQVELRGSELADDPLQRNGPLRGATVYVDLRQYGTLADGTAWVGTPLANLLADAGTIQRGLAERNLGGGTVTLQSQGDVIVAPGATVNTSGGVLNVLGGVVDTSVLIGQNGGLVPIAGADPNQLYVGVANTTSLTMQDLRWGVTSTYNGVFGQAAGTYQAGYVQGADAGSLSIIAPDVIFDGRYEAAVTVGTYQRLPSTTPLAAGQVERPYDQLPLPGSLQIGQAGDTFPPDLIAGSITFSPAPVLPSLHNPDGTLFNPLTDPWPAALQGISLDAALIGNGTAGRVILDSNGNVVIPASVDLLLPPGGGISITAGSIELAGRIAGNGADVSFQSTPTFATAVATGGVRLDSTAVIDVSGAWVNDSPAFNKGPLSTPLAISGGSVSLGARDTDVVLAPGSVIDVSGGGQLTAGGKLKAGNAGSIFVGATSEDAFTQAVPVPLTRPVLGGTLQGYALQGGKGGTLSLSAGAICIDGPDSCDGSVAPGELDLPLALFSAGGFETFKVSANAGALELAPGAQLHPALQNLLATASLTQQSSAPSLAGLASVGALDDLHRLPVSLALASNLGNPNAISPEAFDAALSDLVLSAGSSIVLDPLASLTLASTSRILDDAAISAPGGSVSMLLQGSLAEQDYVASHQIWLGPNAAIDLSGTVRATVDDLGRTVGVVLAGGSLSMLADRGAIETMPGSVINLSGTSGVIDVPVVQATGATVDQSQQVASAGGSLTLRAAEAILLSGSIEAQSGDPSRVPGGTFSLTLDPTQRFTNVDFGTLGSPPKYPYGERLIDIAQAQSPIIVGARTDLPDSYDGRALVSIDQLQQAGFDQVSLQAVSQDQVKGLTGPPLVAGDIRFDGNVSFDVGQRLTLDAPRISSDGGQALLRSPYVSISDSKPFSQALAGNADAGRGLLSVQADQIDLTGALTLTDFENVTLSSRGDIRAIGVQVQPALSLTGALTTSGSLTLDAQQVYPSTLTQFAFTAGAASAGSAANPGALMIRDSFGTASSPPLSAAGALSFTAPTITQGGVVRAPIGSLTFSASKLTLSAGGITSTSADGEVIPFGQTQGGFDFTYPLSVNGENLGTLVYGTDGIPVPAQSIHLTGASVEIAKGATIDVSGGGDLLATEFIPGPTGTQDVLGAGNASYAGAFAILPTAALNYAPYDRYYWDGSNIQPGDSVYLSGGGGVPAGTYAMLPARYALLPGAYLVTPASATYRNLALGQQIAQADGSMIVAGYRVFTGTQVGDTFTSGFDLRKGGYDPSQGSQVETLAQYTATSANQFFTAQAVSADVDPTRLPRDAGTVALSATSDLLLDGTIAATAPAGARGAAVDITSAAIRIVNGSQSLPPVAGVLDLDANSLDALGVESLAIGGTRSSGADGLSIDTQASTIEVASGVQLSAPELLLAATQSVTVDGGARVQSAGPLSKPDSQILLEGDGALLRVAAAGEPTITRSSSSGTQGELTIAAGAHVGNAGAFVSIDSASSATIAGTLDVTGGYLGVSGSRLSLGDAPSATPGTVLSSAVLSGIAPDDLSLASRSSIDFYDGAMLDAQNVTLSAGALRGFGTADTTLAAGKTLTISGLASGSSDSPGTGTARLTLQGDTVMLDGGELVVSGFGSTSIAASGALSFSKTGSLAVAGDLSLSGSVLTGDSGAQEQISASGDFGFNDPASASPPPAPSQSALGATLAITASSIALDSAVLMHSGTLSLTATGATGDVTFGPRASVDLTGITTVFDSVPVSSPGGALTARSAAGSVTTAPGSLIDVSAPDSASVDAGAVRFVAPQGALNVAGSLKGSGGDFSADALSLADLPGLESSIIAGGFSDAVSLRQRGPGDLAVAPSSGAALAARSVSLEADQGGIIIDGSVVSHGALGGSVIASARDDVVVNGTIDARPQDAGDLNGHIELQSSDGGVVIAPGATLAAYDPAVGVQSDTEGALLIRAPQSIVAAAGTPGNHFALDGNLQALRSISIEGFKSYTYASGTIGAADTAPDPASNPLYQDAASFMTQAPLIQAALGSIRGPAPQILPGIEIDAPGDLTLTSSWALNGWRFGDVPGVLTLRAGGNLTFDGSLSDGFTGVSGTNAYLLTSESPSWSYRLAAGADLSAADPLGVQPVDASGSGTGSVIVAAGKAGIGSNPPTETMIRTGTGSIDVAASQDIVLTNRYSVIYTAGIAASIESHLTGAGQLGRRAYPKDGGSISLTAGRDIVGAPSIDPSGQPDANQLVNDWLWRVGTPKGPGGNSVATAWTVNFANFASDIGALGGGNVVASAGRDIVDLSVNVPTVGEQVGGATLNQSDVQVLGGGNIALQAGRDVAGGNVYTGRGSETVIAGNSIRDSLTRPGLFPVIALGEAGATLSARDSVTIESVVNPTILPQGSSQNFTRGNNTSFFSTYGASSGAELRALAGNVELVNDISASGAARSAYTGVVFQESQPDERPGLTLYPGNLQVAALRGDVTVDNSMTLYPEAQSSVDLFADGSVRLGTATGLATQLLQSDADTTLLPTVWAPQGDFTTLQNLLSVASSNASLTAGFHAPVPVHLSDSAPDTDPSRIVALTGDVTMPGSGNSQLIFAEPAQIIAGRDISQLSVEFQNLSASDVSALVAGRDFVYSQVRSDTGQLTDESGRGVVIDGPGTLEVFAGRNINLQTSGGITSQGNLVNAALSPVGADISVVTGSGGSGIPDFSTFIQQYLVDSSAYADALLTYMQPLIGPNATAAQALQAFQTLSPLEQAPLIESIFFNELRSSGRAAAQPGPTFDNFTAGFKAVTALFPGGNPDVAQGETNPYSGDMSLYFSRIYTLSGGNINLLAPGGQINAGLATPPSSLGVSKQPSQLGIVAQSTGSVSAYSFSNFNVNESRVFAADGGNILVWSSRGDIDAGRGAKTAISAPAPIVTFVNGVPKVTFPAALQGSGIQTLATTSGVSPGDVDLFAPHGVVNANDAGIVAGNLTIAATAVLGASNIKVSGISVGVPIDTGGLGVSIASAASAVTSASQAATQDLGAGPQQREQALAPAASSALEWLDVFVEGFGEEVCKPSDTECLKRQTQHP